MEICRHKVCRQNLVGQTHTERKTFNIVVSNQHSQASNLVVKGSWYGLYLDGFNLARFTEFFGIVVKLGMILHSGCSGRPFKSGRSYSINQYFWHIFRFKKRYNRNYFLLVFSSIAKITITIPTKAI